MTSIQSIFAITITAIWPFKSSKDNLISIANEMIFTILSCILIRYNEKSDWNDAIESIYINIILSNCCIVLIASLLTLVILICKKCINKKKNRSRVIRVASRSIVSNNVSATFRDDTVPSQDQNMPRKLINKNLPR